MSEAVRCADINFQESVFRIARVCNNQIAQVRNSWKRQLVVCDDIDLGLGVIKLKVVDAVARVRAEFIEMVNVSKMNGLK